jgi:hypothetical protein
MIGKLDEVVSEMVISESISADGEAMESCMVLRPCTQQPRTRPLNLLSFYL